MSLYRLYLLLSGRGQNFGGATAVMLFCLVCKGFIVLKVNLQSEKFKSPNLPAQEENRIKY